MSDQHPHKDPPIYKHLSPKTQGFLRASAPHREEAARLNDDTMSNEQTYVKINYLLEEGKSGGELIFVDSFIAIKPDGVQVCHDDDKYGKEKEY